MWIKTRERIDGGVWLVWCPACDEPHTFDQRWAFNGDHVAPSFDGSMLSHVPTTGGSRCHSHLRDGVWEYLDDCSHAMAGQRVIAPDWPKLNYGGTKPCA